MIRVPTALCDRLQALAERENNHISAVTRRLLTAALEREDAVAIVLPTPDTSSMSASPWMTAREAGIYLKVFPLMFHPSRNQKWKVARCQSRRQT